MNTVDEILASGRYTDRRGREWQHAWFGWWTPRGGVELPPAQMRLLIERDQHRATCPGLWTCTDHPVPAVTLSRTFRPRVYVDGEPYAWFSEAIDAARALAVGE
ncbi:hypothetical protein [Brevibacterium sp. CT2-23B]|uniref:hypothetical protein n=1 Tax=Brevibacterium sp. CT2-23B TaxID=2729630 RepID=UPI001551E533|nr:hypothetical protein [Brevibacterium sp. CT2-23B]